MDSTELVALEFLRSRGPGEPIYEPDGNVPPDFACGPIAIEVRRLNQHDEAGRGLETSAVPLQWKFEKLLASLGPSSTSSWFVTFKYERPIEPWLSLRPRIEAALVAFRDHPTEGVVRIPICERFSLRIIRASRVHDSCFVLGGYNDGDAGGWLISEVIRNLAIVIPEKSKKIEPYRAKYSAWWLVLIDHIAHARFEPHELAIVRSNVTRPPEWAKIFLVDPLTPDHAIEV